MKAEFALESRKLQNSKNILADLAGAVGDPAFVGEGQEADGAADVQFLRANAEFSAQAEFEAVGEARRSIPVNDGGVDFALEFSGAGFAGGEDAFRVSAAMLFDVLDGFIDGADDFAVYDLIKVLGVPAFFAGWFYFGLVFLNAFYMWNAVLVIFQNR